MNLTDSSWNTSVTPEGVLNKWSIVRSQMPIRPRSKSKVTTVPREIQPNINSTVSQVKVRQDHQSKSFQNRYIRQYCHQRLIPRAFQPTFIRRAWKQKIIRWACHQGFIWRNCRTRRKTSKSTPLRWSYHGRYQHYCPAHTSICVHERVVNLKVRYLRSKCGRFHIMAILRTYYRGVSVLDGTTKGGPNYMDKVYQKYI